MESSIISIKVLIISTILVTGILTFLISRWLSKKLTQSVTTKRIAIWITTVMTTPVLFAGIMIAVIMIASYYPRYRFDQIGWLSNKDRRYEYAEDIINSHMLIGKTKSEVREILGDDGNAQQHELWYYGLGHKPGFFNNDPALLEITFGDEKVMSLKEIR